MQNNIQVHQNRPIEVKGDSDNYHNPRGLRAATNPVNEAIPAEVKKDLFSGVVTDCIKLNVRKAPVADSEILAVIMLLSEVMVDMDNSSDEFYKICTAAGIEGYCVKKYIALRR